MDIPLNRRITIEYVPHPNSLSVRPVIEHLAAPKEAWREVLSYVDRHLVLLHPALNRSHQGLIRGLPLLFSTPSYKSHQHQEYPEFRPFFLKDLPAPPEWHQP